MKNFFLVFIAFFLMTLSSCSFFDKKKVSKNQIPERWPANTNEFCNWGFTGPKYFQCRGKTYVYGSAFCSSSGNYTNIFCEEKYFPNGPACQADNSEATQLCYQLFTNKKKSSQNQGTEGPANTDEFCNWGFAGPKYFQCRGKNYVYGSALCSSSGRHTNIFCEEKYFPKGPACKADNSEATQFCYRLFMSRGLNF